MGELGQHRPQGAIALAGFAGALLPRTFVVAWGHAGPCRQTGRGLKPCHINANLRHDDFCPTLVHPGNGVQEFDGVGKAPQGVTPSSCKTPRAGGSLVWQRVACHKRDRSPNTVSLHVLTALACCASCRLLCVTYAMIARQERSRWCLSIRLGQHGPHTLHIASSHGTRASSSRLRHMPARHDGGENACRASLPYIGIL